MKKATIIIACLLICNLILAQENQQQQPQTQDNSKPKRLNDAPVKEWYRMAGSELIFSSGNVTANGQPLENKVRFSLFLHFQHLHHYNFNKLFGVYTGLALINVGFINKFPIPGSTDSELRQRSYSLGIPLALKFGNLVRGNYIALGVEEEYMFWYKRKVYYQGNKGITSSWFSHDVNQFNPSVFVEIHFHHGFYIRAKSYLMDFLVNKNVQFDLPNSTTRVNFQAQKSSLAYLSIGTVIGTKRKKHATKNDV